MKSANRHATSDKMQISIDRLCVLTGETSSEVRKVVDLLPGIFTQLSVIEGKLQELSERFESASKGVPSSILLKRNMEYVVQHLMVKPNVFNHLRNGD